MESIRLRIAEMGRDPPPDSGECFLNGTGLSGSIAIDLLCTPQGVFGPWPPAESGAEAAGRRATGAGQQGGVAAGQTAVGEPPAHPGPGASAAGQTAQGMQPQVAVEAHVDPGVAAAAEVAQKHGDGESHISRICRGRSTSISELEGTWERALLPTEQRRKLNPKEDHKGFYNQKGSRLGLKPGTPDSRVLPHWFTHSSCATG